jgi:DNA-binding GntR family transcriptional regulator
MSARRHVEPHPRGGWFVKRPDEDDAMAISFIFSTKAEAESTARQLVYDSGGGEVITRDQNGDEISEEVA